MPSSPDAFSAPISTTLIQIKFGSAVNITVANALSACITEKYGKPKGKTNGAKIKHVFKNILQEAENNPLLIGAVLENLLSADDTTRNMQIKFEELLPALLAPAIDYQSITDANEPYDPRFYLLRRH